MHLVYLHQHFSLPSGGSGVRSYRFARHMVAAGWRVTVICGSFSVGATGLKSEFKNGLRSGNVDGIEVIELDIPVSNSVPFARRYYAFFKFAIRSTALIIRLRPISLIYATSTPLSVVFPAFVGKVFLRLPFVFEVRDLWPDVPEAMGIIRNKLFLKILRLSERWAYRNASASVALSPGISDGIRRHEGCAPVHLIPNGCDNFGTCIFDSHELCAVRPALNGEFVNLVYSGTVGFANGLDQLVYAVHMLDNTVRCRLRIYVFGEGSEREALSRLIESLGLSNVIFLLGSVPGALLRRCLSRFDGGLLILKNLPEFYYGTSPNKFFDYIGSGLPVIVNHPGWVADMLQEVRAGYSVRSADEVGLSRALKSFVELSSGEREKMRMGASRLSSEFLWDVLAKEFEKVCSEALSLKK